MQTHRCTICFMLFLPLHDAYESYQAYNLTSHHDFNFCVCALYQNLTEQYNMDAVDDAYRSVVFTTLM